MKTWAAITTAFIMLSTAPTTGAAATELKAFVRGSIHEIVAAHDGAPFILGFWSLTCLYCGEEMALLARVRQRYPDLRIALVSTDTPAESDAIVARLDEHGLSDVANWVFADPFADRLRFEVDPAWYGELPRVYLYEPDGRRRGISGKIGRAQLEHWLATHSRPAREPAHRKTSSMQRGQL